MPVLPLPPWVPPTISSPSRAACARSLLQGAVPPFPPVSCCLLPEYLQGRCLATCGLCLSLAIQPISVELVGARHWGTSVSKTRTLPTWNVNSGFVSPQAFLCIQLLASFRAPGASLPPLSRTYLVPLSGALTSRTLKVPENRVAVVQALGGWGPPALLGLYTAPPFSLPHRRLTVAMQSPTLYTCPTGSNSGFISFLSPFLQDLSSSTSLCLPAVSRLQVLPG